jgi:hypothetical protein
LVSFCVARLIFFNSIVELCFISAKHRIISRVASPSLSLQRTSELYYIPWALKKKNLGFSFILLLLLYVTLSKCLVANLQFLILYLVLHFFRLLTKIFCPIGFYPLSCAWTESRIYMDIDYYRTGRSMKKIFGWLNIHISAG